MSSILLGTLAYSGLNDKSYTTVKRNKLDSVYNSNMENNIKELEKYQVAQNYSKPEYLSQFDDLKVDSKNGPVSINESFKGANSSLQRNLDFQKGYSEFQDTDMHYNVVNEDELTHNNMILYSSRRDIGNLKDVEKKNRKLEAFTGTDSNYTFKKEKIPLFEPMSDLSYVNGSPVVTDQLQNHYLPSNKNNYGNLPFQNRVMVRPGIGPANQQGPYAVYRINPPDVHQLRSDINQKETYNNKPLETIKKGEVRGPDPTLSKFKLPDFREQSVTSLVPTRAVVNQTVFRGNYTNVETQRNEKQTLFMGPKVNTNVGQGSNIDTTKFQESKRENYLNDSSHGVSGVTNKPVMSNMNSFTNYETQRVTTQKNYDGPAKTQVNSNYTIDYTDVPLTTMRQLAVHDKVGIISGPDKNNYIFSNDLCLPITKRQGTSHNIIANSVSQEKSNAVYFNDSAKDTNRQLTSHNIITNSVPQGRANIIYNNDLAKQTGRQETSYNIITNNAPRDKATIVRNNDPLQNTIRQVTSHNLITNNAPKDKASSVYYTDKAKNTTRQVTSHDIITNNAPQEKSNAVYYTDKAKNTTRQETTHDIITNSVPQGKSNAVYYNDCAKPTIRQNTDVTQHVGHAQNVNFSSQYTRDESDNAKPTIRQQTEQTQHVGHAQNVNFSSQYTRDESDYAKPTIRQQTEQTQHVGHAQNVNFSSQYTRDESDNARPTIKQTTLYSTPGKSVIALNNGNYTKDDKDNARTTTRETTLLEDYIGTTHGLVNQPMSQMDARNIVIDERREVTTYNHAPNAKGNYSTPYIDRENYKYREPILFTYVSHPSKKLDFSVMPTSENIQQGEYYSSKPVIGTSSYYISPNFINTLKNNPLVNDIYHQKNIE
jgi:hypothetical protein